MGVITGKGEAEFFWGIPSNIEAWGRWVYDHFGQQHLHRCLTEFDYRYNSRKETAP